MLSYLLVLELLMAAPSAHAREPFQWQVPGLVSTVEVPAQMNVGGIPVRMRVYTSRESVERLLQHFATAFDEAGFYIERNQQQLVAQPHLTALDTRTFTSYTVILQPEPGGLTSVVLGEAKLGERQPAEPSGVFPVYPGAVNPLLGDFEGARTLSFRVAAKEAQVRAWYREQLTRAGYKEESPGLFLRREQRIRLSLSQRGAWTEAVLFLEATGQPQAHGLAPRRPGEGADP
ncbi:hypothetical protein JRI60_39035 [Archangium violaceum]|uniref:hypothetical protein n=1 Tax=Archangium violaceum TaxID=83451 RepID=UPI001951E268|nr:hypothetical protein [Archangium violaceum]QRN95038.1 hypothetical protein JRI60_39035 [Archangium violaceum]